MSNDLEMLSEEVWFMYFQERRDRFAATIRSLRAMRLLDEQRPDTIPLHQIREVLKTFKFIEKEIECDECLSPMTEETARFTICGHKFCHECLERVRMDTPIARQDKTECPTCKHPMNPKYM
jgi:hypothetical protein